MKQYSGKLRIIGGRHRGRVLKFSDIPGLRPTPDRVRETLFNWLTPQIEGTSCLDLFAGSGALGIEAASRGADDVVLVESNRRAAAAINLNLATIGIESARIEHTDAIRYLNMCQQQFDIIFLDPPYHTTLLDEAIEAISRLSPVNPGGAIYLEHAHTDPAPATPPGWSEHRHTKAGDVCGRLYRVL